MLTFYIIGCVLAVIAIAFDRKKDKNTKEEIGYRPSFFIIIDALVYMFFTALSWGTVVLVIANHKKRKSKATEA